MEVSKIEETKKEIKAAKKVLRERIETEKQKLSRLPKKSQQKTLAPDKLMLLTVVVNREKGEYYLDLLQGFCNLQASSAAFGTAAKTFGLVASETEKTVIFCVATEESVKQALEILEKKFATIRRGKGVAFTVPMTSTIGVGIYKFLCNKE